MPNADPTPDALCERFARAMFDEWPLNAVSPALAEASGKPTPLTWEQVIKMGGNHDGLLRLARGAAKLHAAVIQQQQAEIERLSAALEDIANAVRIGAETDLLTWANLANACQQTARSALGKDASDV